MGLIVKFCPKRKTFTTFGESKFSFPGVHCTQHTANAHHIKVAKGKFIGITFGLYLDCIQNGDGAMMMMMKKATVNLHTCVQEKRHFDISQARFFLPFFSVFGFSV
jgi:hypothetical protein